MRTRDKKSHTKFEGRIIRYINKRREEGKVFYVRVAAVDYSIGYSLVDPEDSNKLFTCVNGSLSPHGHSFEKYDNKDKMYDISFEHLLDVLRSNSTYNCQDRDDRMVQAGVPYIQFGGSAYCAFR